MAIGHLLRGGGERGERVQGQDRLAPVRTQQRDPLVSGEDRPPEIMGAVGIERPAAEELDQLVVHAELGETRRPELFHGSRGERTGRGR